MLNKTLFEMSFFEKEFYGMFFQEKNSENLYLKNVFIF